MMEYANILISNVQRFSLHDGPGIRTTVFLKGCSLRCPWCSNPENICPLPEPYVKDGMQGEYGRYVTGQELYDDILKDREFYSDGGGVTFSGGEPLLQIDKLEPVLHRLKQANIHICVETSLFVSERLLGIALRYVDLFYIDCKILDSKPCMQILHGDISVYQKNLDRLFRAGLPVVFRVPVIGGYTDGEENIDRVIQLLHMYRPVKVELLKEHNLGKNKYISLGRTPPAFVGVEDAVLDSYQERIREMDISVEVCKV